MWKFEYWCITTSRSRQALANCAHIFGVVTAVVIPRPGLQRHDQRQAVGGCGRVVSSPHRVLQSPVTSGDQTVCSLNCMQLARDGQWAAAVISRGGCGREPLPRPRAGLPRACPVAHRRSRRSLLKLGPASRPADRARPTEPGHHPRPGRPGRASRGDNDKHDPAHRGSGANRDKPGGGRRFPADRVQLPPQLRGVTAYDQQRQACRPSFRSGSLGSRDKTEPVVRCR